MISESTGVLLPSLSSTSCKCLAGATQAQSATWWKLHLGICRCNNPCFSPIILYYQKGVISSVMSETHLGSHVLWLFLSPSTPFVCLYTVPSLDSFGFSILPDSWDELPNVDTLVRRLEWRWGGSGLDLLDVAPEVLPLKPCWESKLVLEPVLSLSLKLWSSLPAASSLK